jgi:putative methionine-R-sulfoxide reductase with GAF domain
VPNPAANHLRLHIEDAATPPATQLDLPAWKPLQSAYLQLTGWQLDCQVGPLPARGEPIRAIPGLFGDKPGQMYRVRIPEASSPGSTDPLARDLAQAIADILTELQATRGALQQREAELAAVVPVVARRRDEADFNHRLQAILRGTVDGLRGQAAALYLLDETTTELKLRAHWGLPSLRFVQPARALRGAVADLEALTGHAVVMEDTRLFPNWNVPEAFASAVCVPVASPDTLFGTLWLFGGTVRDYSSDETQLLEIVAGRLAVELERRVLLREVAQHAQHHDRAEEYFAWYQERSVQAAPLIEGWQVSSATVPDATMCGDFATWHMGADHRLWLASCSVSGPAARSTLSATLLRGAVQATLRLTVSPATMFHTLNDVLWSGGPGGEGVSTFVGSLDPSDGSLAYVTAGSTDVYILRPHGWEPIAHEGIPLGRDADWHGLAHEQEIHPGDVLLAVSDRHLGLQDDGQDFNTTSLAETLLRHVHLTARELADLAVQLITKRCPEPFARTVLVVKRSDVPTAPSP